MEEEEAQPFFDSRVGLGGRRRRRRAGFEFSEPGEFRARALQDRLHARLGGAIEREDLATLKAQGGEGGRAAEAFERMEAGASGALQHAPPPAGVEWWDTALLPGGAYPAGGSGSAADLTKVTQYVEHPVPVEPEFERPAPAAQPLRLTKKEQKKMRKQRREAREKEKQEMIRQGLLEPPKPKVKISNLARVLGEAAAADPTKIEREVREQAAERERAHRDRNLARMLTPAERRQKKLRKLFGPGLGDGLAEGEQALAVVFKLGHLEHSQARYKVEVNAQQNHLTGCAIRTAGMCAVVVEGGQKALQRFKRLMLARIKWDAPPHGEGVSPGELPGAEGAAAGSAGGALSAPNYCEVVWEGPVPAPAFENFRVVSRNADFLARAYLEEHGVAHYWDLAASYQPAAA